MGKSREACSMYVNPNKLSYHYIPRHIPPYMQHQYPFQVMPINHEYMNSFTNQTMMQSLTPMFNVGFQETLHRPPNHSYPIQSLLENPIDPLYDFQQIIPYEINQHLSEWPINMPDNQKSKMETNGILKYFKTQDGTVDLNKMFSTTGQLIGTLNQLQAFIKGLKLMFKS